MAINTEKVLTKRQKVYSAFVDLKKAWREMAINKNKTGIVCI